MFVSDIPLNEVATSLLLSNRGAHLPHIELPAGNTTPYNKT